MAGNQQLTLDINADATGLTKATTAAAKALNSLQTDIKDLGKTDAELTVDTNTTAAQKQLDAVGADVRKLDEETVAIPIGVQTERMNRDLANLKKVLDGIERQKASPDVGLDITQLLRDEAKVKKAIADLQNRKAEITVQTHVDTTGLEGLASLGATSGGLASLAGLLGKGKLLWAGFIGGSALAVKNVVQLSADAETAHTQLDTLTGSVLDGSKAFDELNRFAKDTPFQFDEITDAARSLLAAGVQTSDLEKTLTAIGDAASATNQDLGDVSVIYGQMLSKGKVSNEELLQLQERGIDAYGILADKLHLTVAEVQNLASQNKLGLDDVIALRDGMEEAYGGSMQRQAETLNGKLSTMDDNIKAIAKDFGDLLLPTVKLLVDILSKGASALDELLDKRQKLQDAANEPDAGFWDSFFAGITQTGPEAVDDMTKRTKRFFGLFTGDTPFFFTFDDTESKKWQAAQDAAAKSGDKQAEAAAKTKKEQALAAEAAARTAQESEKYKQAVEDAQKALDAAAESFAKLGEPIRTKVSFIISRADLEREINKAIRGGKDLKPIELPSNLNVNQIGDLGTKKQDLISNISGFIEQGLEEGARRAQIDPTFDAKKWYKKIRAQAGEFLIDAGVDPKQVNRVLTNIFGLAPAQSVDVKPVVTGLGAAQGVLGALTVPQTVPITPQVLPPLAPNNDPNYLFHLTMPQTVPVTPQVQPPAVAPGATPLPGLTTPQTVPVTPQVQAPTTGAGGQALPVLTAPKTVMVSPAIDQLGVSATGAALKALTAARVVHISPVVDPIGLAIARAQLDALAKDRFSTIYVQTVPTTSPVAPGGTAPGRPGALFSAPGTPGLMAAGMALAAPLAAAAAAPVGPVPGRGVVPGRAGQPPANEPTRLAPKQVPVQVFLDGALIADEVHLRTERMTTTSAIRRSA